MKRTEEELKGRANSLKQSEDKLNAEIDQFKNKI